jgi:hypothetical protein
VVARLPPPESSPVVEVSDQFGISVAVMEHWRAGMFAKVVITAALDV